MVFAGVVSAVRSRAWQLDVAGSIGCTGDYNGAGDMYVDGTGYFGDIVSGAVFEENAASAEIAEYETGTILVITEDGLKPCDKFNDPRVFGVTRTGFEEPIIMGMEPVLVTGKISVGDFIVTSSEDLGIGKYGHGQSCKTALHGSVIAQAMESGDGESYIINAMVRKF